MDEHPLVLGLDYGTDSARALVVDACSGEELASAVCAYPRWAEGRYCDAAGQRFRQHPQDYIDALEGCVAQALAAAPAGAADRIVGIGIDTTGSTPVAVDNAGLPLALRPEFHDNPNAMFVLWKDHTAQEEAEQINALAHGGAFPDYTRFCGGAYSSEWFWAKILHLLRADAAVAAAAVSWVEHCDWLPGLLCGIDDHRGLPRSRCAAGHKAMWHPSWQGLPDEAFLRALDPRLAGLRERLYRDTATAERRVGGLSSQWAERLGLRPGISVAGGAFDAHMGAVGAGAGPHTLARVMGTSTCDMMTVPAATLGDACITGICGQVDGSIVPGLIGLEAGQSSFGDVYAWFVRLLAWPLALADDADDGDDANGIDVAALTDRILPALSRAAEAVPIGAGGVCGVDWLNGRRSPHADQRLAGALAGLRLGADAPAVFRALVEATAFGSRAILECFVEQGVAVDEVLALGGIAIKNPFVMQICADVMNRPIGVVASEQCCALGAAVFGAVAAGVHATVPAAQAVMASPISRRFDPVADHVRAYDVGYERYRRLGGCCQELAAAATGGQS